MALKSILDAFLSWCDKCSYVYKINGFVDVAVSNNYSTLASLHNDGTDRCTATQSVFYYSLRKKMRIGQCKHSRRSILPYRRIVIQILRLMGSLMAQSLVRNDSNQPLLTNCNVSVFD